MIDIGAGLNVLDTLNTDDNVGLYYTKSSGRNGLLIVTKSRNNNYGQCLIGGYNANSSGGLEQYSNTVNILRRSYISSESNGEDGNLVMIQNPVPDGGMRTLKHLYRMVNSIHIQQPKTPYQPNCA